MGRVLNIAAEVGRYGMSLLGTFVLVLACALISDVIFTIFAIVIPAVTAPGSLWFHGHVAGYGFISFGVMFNYIMACSTRGGAVPQSFVEAAAVEERRREEQAEARGHSTKGHTFRGQPYHHVPWCRTCDKAKPPRTHHCSLCGTCVLKMDHHCPWINGCVGYHNQRYFILFLLYLLAGTLYSCLLMAHLFWLHPAASAERYAAASEDIQVVFVFVLAGVIFVTMLLFVGWNGLMVLTNKTAIEYQMYAAHEVNPFDLGRQRNLMQLFGDSSLTAPCGHAPGRAPRCAVSSRRGALGVAWMLLPTLQPMAGDGTHFTVSDYYQALA
jgi:hypothetical protein